MTFIALMIIAAILFFILMATLKDESLIKQTFMLGFKIAGGLTALLILALVASHFFAQHLAEVDRAKEAQAEETINQEELDRALAEHIKTLQKETN